MPTLFKVKGDIALAFLIDLPAKKRIETKFDLAINDPADMKSLFDPDQLERLIEIMYSVLEDPAQVTAEVFGAALHGFFPAVKKAFEEELINFFQHYGQPKLAAVLLKTRQLADLADETAAALVAGPEVDERVQRRLAKAKSNFVKQLEDAFDEPSGGSSSTDKLPLPGSNPSPALPSAS